MNKLNNRMEKIEEEISELEDIVIEIPSLNNTERKIYIYIKLRGLGNY